MVVNDGLGALPVNPVHRGQKAPEVTDWRGAVNQTPKGAEAVAHMVRPGDEGAKVGFRKREQQTSNGSQERGADSQKGPREELTRVTERLNKVVDALDVAVRFEIHDETGRIVVKVVDRETGDVVRQIPPEQMLKISAEMEKLVGLLVDERV